MRPSNQVTAAQRPPINTGTKAADAQQRWFPTKLQIAQDPEKVIRTVLEQHYALLDRHEALLAKVNAPQEKPTGPPPGSGPTDTVILGLRVEPVDSRTLANGATLKWVAADGRFKFS